MRRVRGRRIPPVTRGSADGVRRGVHGAYRDPADIFPRSGRVGDDEYVSRTERGFQMGPSFLRDARGQHETTPGSGDAQ